MKRKKLLGIILFIVLLMFVACKDDENSIVRGEITSNLSKIYVEQEIIFDAVFFDEDGNIIEIENTEDIKFVMNNTVNINKNKVFNTEGTYQFYAIYDGIKSDIIMIKVEARPVLNGTITLNKSEVFEKEEVIASIVFFNDLLEEIDLEGKKINYYYNNEIKISSNKFLFPSAGTYRIYAKYNNVKTNELNLIVKKKIEELK